MTASAKADPTTYTDKSDEGYGTGLKNRHIMMIAIGGAIGTGLFLGASGRLSAGGPALALVYLMCGIFAFIMVRALGEMSVRRPSSGGFVSYAREFMGEKGAYATGWLFFTNWATTVCTDTTAVALYLHYWTALHFFPQWVWALIALALVFTLNMLSVKFFGEFEFWFAMIKVAAIALFMVIAIIAVIFGAHAGTSQASVTLPFTSFNHLPGFLPHGLGAAIALSTGVIFAFGGTELIGIAAGETKDPEKVLPKAINSMIWRIGLLYVGAVILLTMVLPWTMYSKATSPFVTYFSKLGVHGAGSIMNLVVLTAALSSVNAGLYATGRTLRSMSMAGEGPKWAAFMNKGKVPSHGIMITAGIGLIGVLVNYEWPSNAFNMLMEIAGICIAGTWISILCSHMIFVHRCKQGLYERPKYRLRGAPVLNIVTIAFLIAVVLGSAFEGTGAWTLLFFAGVCVLYIIGWFVVRHRIDTSRLESSCMETDPLEPVAAPIKPEAMDDILNLEAAKNYASRHNLPQPGKA